MVQCSTARHPTSPTDLLTHQRGARSSRRPRRPAENSAHRAGGSDKAWHGDAAPAGPAPPLAVAGHQGISTDPVVVLTGPVTASAGEFTAIAFRGRRCTTSMGAATRGLPTGNSSFDLSDGSVLIITTAFDADRTGRVYAPAPIKPDVEVGSNYNASWNQADPTIRAATQWLSLHRNCKP